MGNQATKHVWVTGAERSLGEDIMKRFIESDWEGISLSRGEGYQNWDLNLPPDTLKRMTLELLDASEKAGEVPDVLVHNSGVTEIDFIENAEDFSFERVMRINLGSRWAINKAIVKWYKEHPQYAIRLIHIISMGARYALRSSSPYCCSKAGDVMLVKQMAKELASRTPNVTIFGVSPNGIQGTAMIEQAVQSLVDKRGMSEEEARNYNVQAPFGRNCLMSEVSEVCYFIGTTCPEYMSGHNFELLGGMPA